MRANRTSWAGTSRVLTEKNATAEGCYASYCETLKYLVDDSTSHENFNECILKAGKQNTTITK